MKVTCCSFHVIDTCGYSSHLWVTQNDKQSSTSSSSVQKGNGSLGQSLAAEGHFLVSTISPKVTSQLSSSLIQLEKLDEDPPKFPYFKEPFNPPCNVKLHLFGGVFGSLN